MYIFYSGGLTGLLKKRSFVPTYTGTRALSPVQPATKKRLLPDRLRVKL